MYFCKGGIYSILQQGDSMMLNKYWFRRVYTADFVKVIDYYAKTLDKKILPAFESISEEADLAANEAEERFGRYFDPEHDDPSDYMEAAYHVGVDFYIMASALKQGVVNIFAAGVFHLFEQQLLKLHRQELLTIQETRQRPIAGNLLKVSVVRERLLLQGIDITRFRSWTTLTELRHVANTVKHADGNSCEELKRLRPDLFVHPSDHSQWAKDLVSYRQVVQPLAGEDLYISLNQFKEYTDVVKGFWEELATVVETQ